MFKLFLERSGENIILSSSIIKEKSNLFPFLESLSFFSSLRKIFFEFRITVSMYAKSAEGRFM